RFTPLHLAKDPRIVRLLADHGADLNAESVGGTALQRAAHDVAHFQKLPQHAQLLNDARAVTEVLLQHGAEYDIVSAVNLNDENRVRRALRLSNPSEKQSALRMAATYGRKTIVRLLLENGADPQDTDVETLPVSYFAVEHADILQMLFD